MIMITIPPLSQKMMSTPSLSKKKSKIVEKKSLYYHDRCPSTFPEDEESFSEETLHDHGLTPFLHPFPFLEKRMKAFQRTSPHSLLGKCEVTTQKRGGMIMPTLVDEAPSDARVVVGSLDLCLSP